MPETTDIPVPLPSEEIDMAASAGAVDATIDKVLDQGFAKVHSNWLGTMQHAADGHQALMETGRWTFQAAASNQVQLAAGILAQRSAQAQPQSPGGAGVRGVPGQLPVTP